MSFVMLDICAYINIFFSLLLLDRDYTQLHLFARKFKANISLSVAATCWKYSLRLLRLTANQQTKQLTVIRDTGWWFFQARVHNVGFGKNVCVIVHVCVCVYVCMNSVGVHVIVYSAGRRSFPGLLFKTLGGMSVRQLGQEGGGGGLNHISIINKTV